MGRINQNTTADTHTHTHTKEPEHNAKDGHQTTREQNRKGRKKTYKSQPKTIKKVAIGTYISIITLNVNGLNVPTKRHRLAEQI